MIRKAAFTLLLLLTHLVHGQVSHVRMTVSQEAEYVKVWRQIDNNIRIAASQEKAKLLSTNPDATPQDIDFVFQQQYSQFKPKADQYLKTLLLVEVPRTPKSKLKELTRKTQTDLKSIWDAAAESFTVGKRSSFFKRMSGVGGLAGKVAAGQADNVISSSLRGVTASGKSVGNDLRLPDSSKLFGSSIRGASSGAGGRPSALELTPDTSFSSQPNVRPNMLDAPIVPKKISVTDPVKAAPIQTSKMDLEKAARDFGNLENQLKSAKQSYKSVADDLAKNPIGRDSDELSKNIRRMFEDSQVATANRIKTIERQIESMKSLYGAEVLKKVGTRVKVKRAIKIAIGVFLVSAVGLGLFGGLFAYFHGNP
jgi:hypothetical protein